MGSTICQADEHRQYITLNLKAAGFTTFEVNLLTIPAYVIFIINLLVLTWLSEKLNERFLLASISQIWVLPLLIALESLPATRSHWVTWILSVLLFAQPYAHAIIVAITSRNAGTVRTRTVASALYNMSVQTSSIIGSNVSNAREEHFRHDMLMMHRYTDSQTRRCIEPVTRS
jgi:hypothetical protein